MSSHSTGKVALAIVLLSESVLFGTLLAAYAVLRDEAHWAMPRDLPRLLIPLANTMILLLSVWPARRTETEIRAGHKGTVIASQLVTLALGLMFVAGQAYDFSHAGLQVDDNAFGGVFFALMGFHAMHVLAGVAFLVINLVRASGADLTAADAIVVEVGSLFWYYVVAVWLVLFTALYLV